MSKLIKDVLNFDIENDKFSKFNSLFFKNYLNITKVQTLLELEKNFIELINLLQSNENDLEKINKITLENKLKKQKQEENDFLETIHKSTDIRTLVNMNAVNSTIIGLYQISQQKQNIEKEDIEVSKKIKDYDNKVTILKNEILKKITLIENDNNPLLTEVDLLKIICLEQLNLINPDYEANKHYATFIFEIFLMEEKYFNILKELLIKDKNFENVEEYTFKLNILREISDLIYYILSNINIITLEEKVTYFELNEFLKDLFEYTCAVEYYYYDKEKLLTLLKKNINVYSEMNFKYIPIKQIRKYSWPVEEQLYYILNKITQYLKYNDIQVKEDQIETTKTFVKNIKPNTKESFNDYLEDSKKRINL